MELYIKKWWGNYVGGCDDTFLLLDYFGSQKQSNLELSKILSDIHLNTLLKENSVNEGDIYFSINESYEPHFDMAIDVIIDLSAILLESIKNGKVDIKELDPIFYSDNDSFLLILKNINYYYDITDTYKRTAKKTQQNIVKIIAYLTDHNGATSKEIANILKLSTSRTRSILNQMNNIHSTGENNGKRYWLDKK